MAKPRDPRVALGLRDAAQVVREQRSTATRSELDSARRIAFQLHKNQALIKFAIGLDRSARATFGRRRHVGEPKGNVQAIMRDIAGGEKQVAVALRYGLSVRTIARYKKKYMTG